MFLRWILGCEALERALEGFSFVEFYGEWPCVLRYAHFALSRNTPCLLVYTQLFGGLNAYQLLGREIRVARAFDLLSTIEALRRAFFEKEKRVFVFDPFLFSKPQNFSLVTSALRALSHRKWVLVFNRAFKKLPAGGHFHASSANTLLRLEPLKGDYLATLIKHPALSSGVRFVLKTEQVVEGVGLLRWIKKESEAQLFLKL